MLTGSVASSTHGKPRSTQDIDLVVAPTAPQIRTLIQQFPSADYYADEQQALEALASRSQFNIIDFSSGWKVDFIIVEDSDYGRTAFARRKLMDVAGISLYVASPEDVLIAKLRWAKMGASERQLQDATGILATQGSGLDGPYIEHWVQELELEDQWQTIRKSMR